MNLYKWLGGSFYDGYFAPGRFSSIYIKYIDYLQKNMIIAPDFTVCDVGCGSGTLLKKLCTLGIQEGNCTGIDPSLAMIGEAQKKLPKATIIQATAHEYVIHQTYDLVYSSISFHHFDLPIQSLQKMIDACKIGGDLIIIDISFDHVSRGTEILNFLQRADGGIRCYSVDERIKMFEQCGIGKERVRYHTLKASLLPIKLYHVKL